MEKRVYSQEEVDEIKREVAENNNKQMILEFAKKFNNVVSDNLLSKKNTFSNKFNQETVSRYLENPTSNEKELRQLSTVLMTLSPQYQQIINYLSSISMYIGIVKPVMVKFTDRNGKVDVEKVEREVLKASYELDRLNIAHEFQRITGIVVREDVFYGYIYESSNSFYISQLDSDYCKISSISDGCLNYMFDFSYFDKNNKIEDMEIELIETFPSEFKTKYKLYLKDKRKYRWQELDEDNTICIKFMEDIPFAFTPFGSLFNDLSDLNDYKDMAKNKTEVENYKFIGMKIPLNKDTERTNNFAVDVEVALQFYNMLLGSLPNGIGAFITPTEFEDIDFGSGSSSSDITTRVKDAEDNVFSSAGVSGINFGKGATSSSGITSSNNVDSSRVFRLYRQFERWLNRRFKRLFKDRFSVKLIDVTRHNYSEVVDRYLKLAQFGVPVKLELSALLGVSQNLERGSTYLENEVLHLHKEWIPLASTHTGGTLTANEGENEKEVKDLSDEGERTKDLDRNDK